MKTKLKRSDIIKALLKEPLRAGAWIQAQGRSKYDHKAKRAKCKVCAVGAIFRHNFKGLTISEVSSLANQNAGFNGAYSSMATDRDIQNHLKDFNYLSALSAYFETTAPKNHHYTKKYRDKLVTFVKENFPATITVA